MNSRRFDVLGIGNAIVDVLAKASDDFLANEEIPKGVMSLISEERAATLHAKMKDPVISSGGSAANTVAGIAGLGGRAAYIGKVRNDRLGGIFRKDMKASGVHYDTPDATEGPATACCMVFTTPDGHRSMNTFLGASTDFTESDISEELIRDSAITYLEGYLYDKPQAQAAFAKGAALARRHGNKVALTLSDPFCVNRHRAAFLRLLGDVDILFANEAEACALYEKNALEEVLPVIGAACDLVVVTRSEEGAIILDKGKPLAVSAEKAQLVDSTGAGDMFAAGFLYGYTDGRPLAECGRIAAICGAEAVNHWGPRPQTDLKKLVATRLKAA